MRHRELNVFSVSFLDLLSGALAAVIILFVVVPKINSEQSAKIEVLDSLNVQVNELDSLLQLAQNAIPDSIYNQLQQKMDQLQQTLDSLNNLVEEQSQQLQQCTEERQELVQQLEEVQQQLSSAYGPGQMLFGINAKFAVVCQWTEDVDIDLYMEDNASGQRIYFNVPNTSFGAYLVDVQRHLDNDGQYEMIYQGKVVPGNYSIYYNYYSGSENAHVSGYVILNPFSSGEQKVTLPEIEMRPGMNKRKIARVALTGNNFQLTLN